MFSMCDRFNKSQIDYLEKNKLTKCTYTWEKLLNERIKYCNCRFLSLFDAPGGFSSIFRWKLVVTVGIKRKISQKSEIFHENR